MEEHSTFTMPTSSQSLILLKTDYGNLINFYKHRIQYQSSPLAIPKVNVTGNLPFRSPPTNQPQDLVGGYYMNPLTTNGRQKEYSYDYVPKPLNSPHNLPNSVRRKEVLPSMYKNKTEDFVNRHSHIFTGSDDVKSEHEARDIDDQASDAKANDYWKLLDMGFSVSSFKGLQGVTPPHINSGSVRSIGPVSPRGSPGSQRSRDIRHASSVPERTKPSKLSVSDFKSSPKLDITRRKSGHKSWYPDDKKHFGVTRIKSFRNGEPLMSTFHDTTSTPHRPTLPHHLDTPVSLMTKQGMWNPVDSLPKPRRPRRIHLRDFFPQNFDLVSVLSETYLEKLRLTRNPRLKRSSKELPRTPDVLEDKENEDGIKPQITKLEKKKSMKLPTIRMRKFLPPSVPGALCFTLKGVNASHEDVKSTIEAQLGCGINTLLFDPVYIHMGEADTEHKTMWVFTVDGGDAAGRDALHQGIMWNGERARIRYFDDVMRDEHNAYKLFKSIQDEKSTKGLGVLRKRINSTEFQNIE